MPFLRKRSGKKPVVDSSNSPEIRSHDEEGGLTKTLHSAIADACNCADIGLWDAYARSVGSQPIGCGAGRLVFPRYRDKGLRVRVHLANCSIMGPTSLNDGLVSPVL